MLLSQPPITLDFKPIIAVIQKAQEKPTEQLYTIKPNDNLTKIAEAHNTTVERLWEKNTQLADPNLIEPDKPLKIPQAGEELPDRPMPVIQPVLAEPSQSSSSRAPSRSPAPSSVLRSVPKGSSSGNTYSYGYCTWHVKNIRGDIPNNLGNADTWLARARAQGMATGDEPRVGAVAWAKTGYMHVAYVTAVHGKTITISEMNFKGWNVASTRTAPAHQFAYIY